jgi:hypothetical protein
MQNFANHTKKVEKKFDKARDEVSEMSEVLDKIDERMVRLIETLVNNGTIKQEDIDPPPKPQPVQRARASKNDVKSKRHSSDSEEEEESEEESDHDARRRSERGDSKAKSRGNTRSMPPPRRNADRDTRRDNTESRHRDDSDDIDAVVRMASGRRN